MYKFQKVFPYIYGKKTFYPKHVENVSLIPFLFCLLCYSKPLRIKDLSVFFPNHQSCEVNASLPYPKSYQCLAQDAQ